MTRARASGNWRGVYGGPLLIGVLSMAGLLAALMSENIGRYFSWIALATPVVVTAWFFLRRRRVHRASLRRRSRRSSIEPVARRSRPTRMMVEDTRAEIAAIIAEANGLPLLDAAYALWRQRYRLNTLERRPTPEQVRAFRAMSPPEQAANMRHHRDCAQDGPTFTHLKLACPLAGDDDIKRAIVTVVRFEDACFKYFVVDSTDYWNRCVRAVALAAKENPGFLENTLQRARNDVAYYNK